jgi:hypothetical protein
VPKAGRFGRLDLARKRARILLEAFSPNQIEHNLLERGSASSNFPIRSDKAKANIRWLATVIRCKRGPLGTRPIGQLVRS